MAASRRSSRRAIWSRWTRSVVRVNSTRQPFSTRAKPSAAARWLLPPPGGPNNSKLAPLFSQASPAASAMTWALLTTGTASKSKVSRVLPGGSRASARWRAFLSNTCSSTSNDASIYLLARSKPDTYLTEKRTPLKDDTFHTPLPKGPAGQFSYHVPFSNLVMGYSKNQKAAKEAFRSLDPFRALREPGCRRRDEKRPFPLRTKNCQHNPKQPLDRKSPIQV